MAAKSHLQLHGPSPRSVRPAGYSERSMASAPREIEAMWGSSAAPRRPISSCMTLFTRSYRVNPTASYITSLLHLSGRTLMLGPHLPSFRQTQRHLAAWMYGALLIRKPAMLLQSLGLRIFSTPTSKCAYPFLENSIVLQQRLSSSKPSSKDNRSTNAISNSCTLEPLRCISCRNLLRPDKDTMA